MDGVWWVADALEADPVFLFAWLGWIIVSICLHELAHGWAAIRLGDRTPIELGHMTWNPVVHMGWMSLLFLAVVGIAWGAMPVNEYRMRGRYPGAQVAFAGPAMNLVIAGVCAVVGGVLVGVLPAESRAEEVAWTVFTVGAGLNVVLALFNLVPVPPLDGSRIAAEFFPQLRPLYADPRAGIFGLIALFLLIRVLPVGIFDGAFLAGAWGVGTIAGLIEGV